MTTPETFVKLRTDAGLSVKELADASGVPMSTIGAIERGTRRPLLETARKICRAMKKSLKVFDATE